MKRLKTISAIATLALALTAIAGASSASASGFLVSGEPTPPVTFTGSPTSSLIGLNLYGESFACTPPTLTAGETGPLATMTMSGQFGSCGKPSSFNMNGCNVTFEPGADEFAGEKEGINYKGTFGIGPAGCGPIKAKLVFMSSFECEIAIYPNSAFKAEAHYFNTKAEVEVTTKATELEYKSLSGPCSTSIKHNGEWNAKWFVSAKDKVGKSLELKVGAMPGVYLAGASAEAVANRPRIAADSYPAALASESGSTFKFTGSTNVVQCNTTTMSAELSAATSLLSLTPAYGKCTGASGGPELPLLVAMNSCHYTLGVLNTVGPPSSYAGTMGAACSKEGDKIEYKVYANETFTTVVCTLKLGPQAGRESVSLANKAVEGQTAVEMNANAKGLSWEKSGLCGKASGTDGSITYSTTLGA